jgi:hypothetical protein
MWRDGFLGGYFTGHVGWVLGPDLLAGHPDLAPDVIVRQLPRSIVETGTLYGSLTARATDSVGIDLGSSALGHRAAEHVGEWAHARQETIDPLAEAGEGDRAAVDARIEAAESAGTGHEIENSGYQRDGRPATQPDVTPTEIQRALRDLRPHFPHDRVWIAEDRFRVEMEDGTSVTIRVEVGAVPEGRVSTARFDEASGEYVVRLSQRLGAEHVPRALVEQASTIVEAGLKHSGQAYEVSQLKQLDVLATERARVQWELTRNEHASVEQRLAWEHERARLNWEFRIVSERLGILAEHGAGEHGRGEHGTGDTEAIARERDRVWADLSDPARAALFEMVDPNAVVGASAKARSFLPLTDAFREPYNAIDNVSYYLELGAPEGVRARFSTELLPRIREFQHDALAEFKVVYREFFPSTSAERPLSPERAAEAQARVEPLVEQVRGMVEEIRTWAAGTGEPGLRGEGFDVAIELGGQIWQARYESYRHIVDEVVVRYDYLGEPLGYIGSMQDGMRGPHKAMSHADLRGFDIDMYVVHREDFDARYDTVMEHDPAQISRGKIFPRIDGPGFTPELYELSQAIAAELARRFPGNTDILDSMVVLRREPPY